MRCRLAVVLSNGAPLPFAQIRSPFLPRHPSLACVVQPLLLYHINDWLVGHGPCLLLRDRFFARRVPGDLPEIVAWWRSSETEHTAVRGLERASYRSFVWYARLPASSSG